MLPLYIWLTKRALNSQVYPQHRETSLPLKYTHTKFLWKHAPRRSRSLARPTLVKNLKWNSRNAGRTREAKGSQEGLGACSQVPVIGSLTEPTATSHQGQVLLHSCGRSMTELNERCIYSSCHSLKSVSSTRYSPIREAVSRPYTLNQSH